jgi:hypothetical protein
MLKKLLKYEFQATARYFLPLYLLIIVLALLTRLTMSITIESNQLLKNLLVDLPSVLMAFAYGAGLLSIGLVTLLLVVQRFYSNLLGREGYLMFTLPVTPVKLLWSKLLAALVWGAASAAAVIVSLIVLLADQNIFWYMGDFFRELFDLLSRGGISLWMILLLGVAVLLTSALHSYLQIYAAIILGCQAKKYRILLGIVIYIGISMAEQFLMGVGMTILALVPDFSMSLLYLFGYQQSTPEAVYSLFNLVLTGLLVFNVVLGTGYYVLTWQMMKKRLNLE